MSQGTKSQGWVRVKHPAWEEWGTEPREGDKMSSREFPLHYGALKVCCQKKKKNTWSHPCFRKQIGHPWRCPGGYFRRLCKQGSHYQRVALGQFSGHLLPQHRHSSPEGIWRQALLNFYHPPTSVSSSVDFSESLQTLLLEHNTHHMWKKIIGWDHSLGGGGAHSWTFRMLTCWALALKVHVVFLKTQRVFESR